MIRDVTDSDVPAVRAFLERYVETSLFLLSNLAVTGPRLGDHLNSGNFHVVTDAGEIAAVLCLTRRGNLLLQTGGRADVASAILEACDREPIPLRGVVGEWRAAEAVWRLLCRRPMFRPERATKEVLMRLDLPPADTASSEDRVRFLEARDFAQWDRLTTDYLLEQHLPVQGTREQRQAWFTRQA